MHDLGVTRFVLFLVQHLCRGLILRLCVSVLVLFEERVPQVIMRLVAVFVLLQSAAVIDFRLRIVLRTVVFVAVDDVKHLFLRKGVDTHEQQGDRQYAVFSENIHFGNRFVLAVEDKEVDDEQQQRNQSKALELLVVVRKYLCLDLLGRQFVEFLLDGFGGGVRVVATNVDTTAGLGNLTTHVLVQTTHDHIALTVLAEVIRTRHGDR